MKKVISGLVVVFVCLAAFYGVAEEEDASVGLITPCVAITGADSHISERSYYRIESAEEWATLWQKHKGSSDDAKYDFYYDPFELPLVNFDEYVVIGIFQGSGWNSAGLKAVSVAEEDHRAVFRFENKFYQTAGPNGGGKKVTVYGFFVIPRSVKALTLAENVQGLIGSPPIWKERATFPRL